jgi:cardiolipin synthase
VIGRVLEKSDLIVKQIISLLYIAYLLFVVMLVFFSRKKPIQRFSWILVLVFFPVVGVVFYLLLGSESYWDYKRHKIRRRHRHLFNELDRILQANSSLTTQDLSLMQDFHVRCCGSMVSSDNDVEIYTNGAAKFERLFADLRGAQDHIHVQYFTIHNDEIGQELINILKEKVLEGVEVKLLYDSFGCFLTWVRPLFWELKHAGGQVRGIRPYARALNYRNHRKLVIIDGRIGYLGGMNAGEHYVSGVRGMVWRDTHLRIIGHSVHDVQQIFMSDWIASSPKLKIGFRHRLRHYFPDVDSCGNLSTQIIANGLYNKHIHQDVINLSYFSLINNAQQRLWIQTPYFSPSEPILQSLKILALSGVDVRIMTSAFYAFGGLFHHNIKNYYFRQLIDSGVRVFRYKGIMHAKTMLIDSDKLVIGTVNLNIRSLERDDELYAYLESGELNKEHAEILESDFKQCVELDYARFQKQTLLSRALESVVSLFSPFS